MKKLLSVALTALVFLSAPVYAGNTATAQTAQKISIGGVNNVGTVTPVAVTFDTADTDLTVYTPDSDKMACVVGMTFSEATASNLTIKSGSTSLIALELAANQGVYDKMNNGVLLCTQPGEALKMRVSAVISSLLVNVIQAAYLNLNGGK